MPQIYIIFGPETKKLTNSKEMVLILQRSLIGVVDNEFMLAGLHDTASTAVQALSIVDEADIQVEIRYTAGRDEYCRGKPFDPTLGEQGMLCAEIQDAVRRFLEAHNLPKWSLSVWCKPYYNSEFKQHKR